MAYQNLDSKNYYQQVTDGDYVIIKQANGATTQIVSGVIEHMINRNDLDTLPYGSALYKFTNSNHLYHVNIDPLVNYRDQPSYQCLWIRRDNDKKRLQAEIPDQQGLWRNKDGEYYTFTREPHLTDEREFIGYPIIPEEGLEFTTCHQLDMSMPNQFETILSLSPWTLIPIEYLDKYDTDADKQEKVEESGESSVEGEHDWNPIPYRAGLFRSKDGFTIRLIDCDDVPACHFKIKPVFPHVGEDEINFVPADDATLFACEPWQYVEERQTP